MSLTREQLEEIYESCKRVDNIILTTRVFDLKTAHSIMKEIREIKKKIESVIGQME